MILGIISFCFIMFIFTKDPTDNTKMTFEVSHVWVFLFACFHTFVVALCIYMSLGLSKRWKDLERMDLVRYLEQKEKYRKLNERRNKHNNPLWRHFGWWITSPRKYFSYGKLHETMAFHDIRWQFIYFRNLTPDFRFSKYLRKIKFATFIELVEINPFCWIILLCFIGLDMLRYHIGSNPNFEAAFLIAHSVLNMFLASLLARKIRSVYYRLTKNPATYYDNIDPTAFRRELAIAEEEARIRGETGGDVTATNIDISKKQEPSAPTPPPPTEVHHQAIHHNMAYVPEHDNSETDHRYSLDVNKGNDAKLVKEPSGTSDHLVETAKRTRDRRQSSDLPGMAAALPVQELDFRARPSQDIQVDHSVMKRVNTSRRDLRMEALRRLRERKEHNAAIVENAQDVQAAQSASPRREYHWIIVKLFPRLGRVASAAEKLFWFGSHRFYLFCVELVLFFMNVNVSTAIAYLAFNYKERAYIAKKATKEAAKKAGKPTARFIISEVIRLTKKQDPRDQSLVLLWISFAVGLFAMLFVLLRIADIMKKYIFVLNNANLLPESMLTQTIRTVSLKDAMEEETMRKFDDRQTKEVLAEYDSDTDDDGQADYSSMRRNMSTFFEREGTTTDAITGKV